MLQTLLWLCGTLGSGVIAMILWASNAVVRRIDKLERGMAREFRHFDRRLTVVETKLNVTPSFALDDDAE